MHRKSAKSSSNTQLLCKSTIKRCEFLQSYCSDRFMNSHYTRKTFFIPHKTSYLQKAIKFERFFFSELFI